MKHREHRANWCTLNLSLIKHCCICVDLNCSLSCYYCVSCILMILTLLRLSYLHDVIWNILRGANSLHVCRCCSSWWQPCGYVLLIEVKTCRALLSAGGCSEPVQKSDDGNGERHMHAFCRGEQFCVQEQLPCSEMSCSTRKHHHLQKLTETAETV